MSKPLSSIDMAVLSNQMPGATTFYPRPLQTTNPGLVQLGPIFLMLDARGQRTVLAAAVEQLKIQRGE